MTRTSALFISHSISVCPYPSRCHISLHTNNCHHTHISIYLHSPSSSQVHLCWYKCSVPLQDWAVFIIPSSYNLHISPLSNTIPIRSVTSEDSFKLFTAASTTVMLCGLTQQNCSNVTYICTISHTILELLIYQDSSITIHYAVCQPLQLSPCQEVHPQGVIELPLEQASNIELLCLPRGRVPWFWFLAWGWSIQITVGSTSFVLAAEVMLHMLPHYQGTLFVVTMSNRILDACKSHHGQMFQLM